jgi:trans-2,3-dihydro-3-hydroxyanthranilate isomerase
MPQLLFSINLFFAFNNYAKDESQVAGKKTIQARLFSPGMSGEDPATGSAAGPLARYLYEYGSLDPIDVKTQIVVKHGQAMGRDCLIQVELEEKNPEINVSISANCFGVVDGEIVVPNADIIFSS